MKKYTFYKDNKLDKTFTLSLEEIESKFIDWMKNQQSNWLEYYAVTLVSYFVFMKDGLNSHSDDVDELSSKLQKTKWDYLKSIGIK